MYCAQQLYQENSNPLTLPPSSGFLIDPPFIQKNLLNFLKEILVKSGFLIDPPLYSRPIFRKGGVNGLLFSWFLYFFVIRLWGPGNQVSEKRRGTCPCLVPMMIFRVVFKRPWASPSYLLSFVTNVLPAPLTTFWFIMNIIIVCCTSCRCAFWKQVWTPPFSLIFFPFFSATTSKVGFPSLLETVSKVVSGIQQLSSYASMGTE